MANKEITAYEEMEKRYADGWCNVIAKLKVEKIGNDFFYMGWKIYPEMPEGYFEDKNTGSPLSRTIFIINGSPLRGGKRALLYTQQSNTTEKTKKMKLKTTIAIKGMSFRVYEDNGIAICHTSASVPQKIADKVKSLSGRYLSISEVTKSVINIIRGL